MTPSEERSLIRSIKKIVEDVMATRDKVDVEQDEMIKALEKRVKALEKANVPRKN